MKYLLICYANALGLRAGGIYKRFWASFCSSQVCEKSSVTVELGLRCEICVSSEVGGAILGEIVLVHDISCLEKIESIVYESKSSCLYVKLL